jgi:hypothetical protein
MRKGEQEIRCIAVYLSTGIDVRDGDETRRTRLVPDKWFAERLNAEWATQLRTSGVVTAQRVSGMEADSRYAPFVGSCPKPMLPP